MDILQAAYLVCVAVRLVCWLHEHLKGPDRKMKKISEPPSDKTNPRRLPRRPSHGCPWAR